MKTLDKKELKDQRYYSGYEMQNYCVISNDQPLVIAKWDIETNSFWYWKQIGIGTITVKANLSHMSDIDSMDEISEGFVPVKEIFPKEEYIID